MLSVQEIEQAIERLPKTERDALESRLLAKRCGLSGLSDDEQAELLRSLVALGSPRSGISLTQLIARARGDVASPKQAYLRRCLRNGRTQGNQFREPRTEEGRQGP